jgi:hypothetical protein
MLDDNIVAHGRIKSLKIEAFKTRLFEATRRCTLDRDQE